MLMVPKTCFRVDSASDAICSAYAQLILNDGFSLLLSKHKNWLLVGWPCATIGYYLAELMQKLVTRWLSKCLNCLLTGWAKWAYAKTILVHTQSNSEFFLCSTVTRSSVPFYGHLSNALCPCLMSLFLVWRLCMDAVTSKELIDA